MKTIVEMYILLRSTYFIAEPMAYDKLPTIYLPDSLGNIKRNVLFLSTDKTHFKNFPVKFFPVPNTYTLKELPAILNTYEFESSSLT